MAAALSRLVMLLALALMPFSMASAPAAVLPTAAPTSASHCGEHQKPADAPSAPKAHCAACTALPAIDTPAAIAELRPAMLLLTTTERWVAEQGPEIDTPPPKLG